MENWSVVVRVYGWGRVCDSKGIARGSLKGKIIYPDYGGGYTDLPISKFTELLNKLILLYTDLKTKF